MNILRKTKQKLCGAFGRHRYHKRGFHDYRGHYRNWDGTALEVNAEQVWCDRCGHEKMRGYYMEGATKVDLPSCDDDGWPTGRDGARLPYMRDDIVLCKYCGVLEPVNRMKFHSGEHNCYIYVHKEGCDSLEGK